MPVSLRSQESIINDVLTNLKSARNNIDISSNTIINDIVTAICGSVFAFQNTLYLSYVNMFLDDVDSRIANGTIDSAQLDSLGDLYGLTRQGSTFASGFVYLIFNQIPQADFTVGIGEIVSTQDFSQSEILRYITLQQATFTLSNLSAYFVQDLNQYAIQVQVLAERAGSLYNRPSGAIVQLISTIPNIGSCINLTDITGGTDTESDQQFADRINQVRNKPLGFSQIGGITSFLLGQPGITNVITLRQGDPEVVREIGNGVVDVYIRDISQQSGKDTLIYSGINTIILVNQPVVQVNSVSTLNASLIENVNYTVNFDITSVLQGSSRAQTFIQIFSSVSVGDQITIDYIYNQNPGFYTNYFSVGENRIEGRDLLCFQGTAVPMFFAINITRFPEFLPSVIQSVVTQRIFDFVTSHNLLGETIKEGDLIAVVVNTSGVSNIDLNSVEIRKLTDPVGTREDIVVDRTSYVTITFETIVITVTN